MNAVRFYRGMDAKEKENNMVAPQTYTPRTIGQPTKGRVVAGALALLAGAGVLAVLTLADVAPPWMLLALGATAVVAWLVDGTSTRYLGPGLMALAAGVGIVIGNELGWDPRKAEHSLVYGGFGIGLLLLSYVNPMAARAAGAFLLYTGLTVLFVGLNMGWWLTGILVVWGVYSLIRGPKSVAARSDDAADVAAVRHDVRPNAGVGARS